MRPRPFEIVICLETTATLTALRALSYTSLCDQLGRRGYHGKIARVDVFMVKRLKAGTPEGGAG